MRWVADVVWGAGWVGRVHVCEGGVWTLMGYRKCWWAGVKGYPPIRIFYAPCMGGSIPTGPLLGPSLWNGSAWYLPHSEGKKVCLLREWITCRCCRPWACPGLPIFLARQAVIRGWWRLPVSGDELSAFLGAGFFPRGNKGARLWKGPIIGGSVLQNDYLWVK